MTTGLTTTTAVALVATLIALAHSCCISRKLAAELEYLESPLAPALSGSPCITPLDDCLLAQAQCQPIQNPCQPLQNPCQPIQSPLLAKIAQLKALKRAKLCGGLLSPELKLKLLLAQCL